MDEIVWIRPAGYDPAVQPGTILCPEPGLPEFRVVARRPVVMMFHAGPSWDIRPFTQLTLRLVEPEMAPALSTGRSIPTGRADPDPTPAQTMPVR